MIHFEWKKQRIPRGLNYLIDSLEFPNWYKVAAAQKSCQDWKKKNNSFHC